MTEPGGGIVRFACIGDVHGRVDHVHAAVEWLADRQVSAVLMTGDFAPTPCNRGLFDAEPGPVQAALDAATTLGVPVMFVPGNHDQREQPLVGNIDGRMVTHSGVRIAGVGGAGPARHGFPYEWSEDEIRARGVPAVDLVLSHAPPARTGLDRLAHGGGHVGSEAIREIAERGRGVLVCGHIHESVGTERLERCLCYNVGSLGAPYGRLQLGLLDLDLPAASVRVIHHDLEHGITWEDQWSWGDEEVA